MSEFTVKFTLNEEQVSRLQAASKRYVEKGYTAAANIENLFDAAMQMGAKAYIEEKLDFLEVNSKGVPGNKELAKG